MDRSWLDSHDAWPNNRGGPRSLVFLLQRDLGYSCVLNDSSLGIANDSNCTILIARDCISYIAISLVDVYELSELAGVHGSRTHPGGSSPPTTI
jgi:hypothetical protein